MPLRDGSNLPVTVPQSSAFDFIGNSQEIAAPLRHSSQPLVVTPPQASGSKGLLDSLNGLFTKGADALNSVVDAVVDREVDRISKGPEASQDSTGLVTDQPKGQGVEIQKGSIFDDKKMLVLVGAGTLVLLAVALKR